LTVYSMSKHFCSSIKRFSVSCKRSFLMPRGKTLTVGQNWSVSVLNVPMMRGLSPHSIVKTWKQMREKESSRTNRKSSANFHYKSPFVGQFGKFFSLFCVGNIMTNVAFVLVNINILLYIGCDLLFDLPLVCIY